MAAPVCGEEEEMVAGVGGEQGSGRVLRCLAQAGAGDSGEVLAPEGALGAQGYPDATVGKQIGGGKRALGAFDDLGAAAIGVLLAQSKQFFADDAEDFAGVGQQIFEVSDALPQLLMFILELPALKSGQASQGHIQNRLRLRFGEAEGAHQVGAGGIDTLAAADGLDHLVQDVECLEKPFNDV